MADLYIPSFHGTRLARAPGGGALYPNKPSGWSELTTMDFSMAVPGGNGGGLISTGTERSIPGAPSGWRLIYDADGSGDTNSSNFTRISDATEPGGQGHAWRLTMQGGTYTDGTSHGNVFYLIPGGPSKLYACYTIKYDADFIWHSISNKHLNLTVSGGQWLVQSYEATAPGMWWRIHDYVTDTAYTPSINTAIALGVWHTVEVIIELSSPGALKVWIDGVQRTNTTNLNLGGTFTEGFGIYGHRGGGGEALAHDVWYDLGYVHLAVP